MIHIQRDWHIEFDEERYVAQAGSSLSRLMARSSVRADWEAALADAHELIKPAAVWDTFPIREFRHERLTLANGTRIGGGPVASVVAGATDLVVGVCTVGGTDPIEMVKRLGSKIEHVHWKDWPAEMEVNRGKMFGAGMSGIPLGTGVVDIKGVYNALVEVGYDGYTTPEIAGDDAVKQITRI